MSTIGICTRASRASLSAAARPSAALTRSVSTRPNQQRKQQERKNAYGLPPQSPDYIKVPRARQDEMSDIVPPRVRGQLPAPRPVVSDSHKDRKLRPNFLKETAPEPTSEASKRPVAPYSPTDVHRRMAEARRRNLVEGFEGLLSRKKEYDEHSRQKSAWQRADARRLRNRREREVDVLTRPTVLQSTLHDTAVLPDPLRFERAEASRQRTAQLAEDRRADRRAALLDLYATATNFIVNEKELYAEVDRIFSPDYFRKQARSQATDAANAWEVWGAPPNLTQLSAGSNAGALADWDTSRSERSARRQKTIAEELTGGKME